tara:strand:- start:588 stop:1178 length:591 start_codon:yes stop_codon:yes gene_type:complete
MDIESNPYPQSVTSVPALIKGGQLYLGDKLNEILNDVNQFHIGQQQGQQQQGQQQQGQQGQQQRMPQQGQQGQQGQQQGQQKQGQQGQQRMPQQGQQQQQQGQQRMPQQGQQQNQGKKKDEKVKEEDITGLCGSESCLYESIDSDSDNHLNGAYCFLDDGYSENKPNAATTNNKGSEDKIGRFDNTAYEEMMKNRG